MTLPDTPNLAGALCVGMDPELWFADDRRAATDICSRCPVRVRCLTEALARGEADGTWGGVALERTTRSDRRILRAEVAA